MSGAEPQTPDNALPERIRAMLADTAAHHGLTAELQDTFPDEVRCIFPQQTGLDFEIWVAALDDDVQFGGDRWFAEVSSIGDFEDWQLVCDAVDGLITGETRIRFFHAWGRKRSFAYNVQLRRAGRWKHLSGGLGCAFPPIARTVTVRNGHPAEHGGLRPAWGTLLFLGLLTGFAGWLFS